MKKALSLLLVFSLLMAMSATALASGDSNDKKEIRVIDQTGHGQYTITKSNPALKGADNGVVATPTDIDDTVYYLEAQDLYLVEVFTDNYLLMERIDIASSDDLHNLGADQRMTPEALANLEGAFRQQSELRNDDFYASAFVPAQMENTEPGISTYADGDSERSDHEYYTTEDGYNMRDTNLKYWSMHIEYKKEGKGVSEVAKATKELIVNVLGMSGAIVEVFPIPFFGIFKSAYDLYTSINGGVSFGSDGDYINTLVVYDKLEKYTAIAHEPNTWVVGGISKRVWLKEETTTQLYVAKGKTEVFQEDIGTLIESQHFVNTADYIDRSGKLEISFNDSINYKLNGVNGYL